VDIPAFWKNIKPALLRQKLFHPDDGNNILHRNGGTTYNKIQSDDHSINTMLQANL
jgi:hypothetical protein